jgi:beta-glucosidase
MRIRNFLATLLLLALAAGLGNAAQAAAEPAETRIESLIEQMTLAEKLQMLGGDGKFDSMGVPRLGIAGFKMSDGPTGIANAMLETGPRATAFPASVALAASWNPALIRRSAAAIAREARSLGRNMLLGPCVNLARVPQGGRNFESYSDSPRAWLRPMS